jgi:hypothetical protein
VVYLPFWDRVVRADLAVDLLPGLRPRFGARVPVMSSERWVLHRSFSRFRVPTLTVTVSVAGAPQVSHTRIICSVNAFSSLGGQSRSYSASDFLPVSTLHPYRFMPRSDEALHVQSTARVHPAAAVANFAGPWDYINALDREWSAGNDRGQTGLGVEVFVPEH